MAELIGTIAAATQTAEYCLKLCVYLQRTIGAITTLHRYRAMIQELQLLLEKVSANSSLQTTEIHNSTRTLRTIIETIQVPDSPEKKNRLLTSIVFVFRKRLYDETFSMIEREKSTLSLCIQSINSSILDEVRRDVRCLSNGPIPNSVGNSSLFASGNEHKGTGRQVLGITIKNKHSRVTDQDVVKFNMIKNRHTGNGDQIVGQVVGEGCKPVRFTGKFIGNEKSNKGDQIIGLCL
ncbi:hypothetical protein F5B19DRAFT_18659 [Rostrohypoxylon terebratum]|nr:hypothetical protein F5B19DRAFT_18659 [Rostrohypoxylon terebratum]